MADWMPGVERIPTAAFDTEPFTPLGLMSHIMQGSQQTMIEWAEERPVSHRKSAHFTVGKNGRKVQHVPINRRAWHAGRLDPGHPPVWRLLPLGGNPNQYAIGIEHEGFTGEPWTEAMIEATIDIHKWVFSVMGWPASLDTVIGHFMTSPVSRAHDPGAGWPRQRIIEALRAETAPDTARPSQADFESGVLNGYYNVLGWRLTVQGKNKWLIEGPQ